MNKFRANANTSETFSSKNADSIKKSTADSSKKPNARKAKNKKSIDYKSAGVDILKGDEFVDWIGKRSSKKSPHQAQIVEAVGGFASLFRLPKGIKNPCIVSCTDGVGTKVKLAVELQYYEGIGQDLVAMCVNDLMCTGGSPLFFLDYLAMGKLDLNQAKHILASIKKACDASSLALVGGETAEMPGVYAGNDFDCAGFSVGVVDEKKRWGAHNVKVGDVLIALPSSGFHSNGYSLVRKIFAQESAVFKKSLLTPTFLYVEFLEALKSKLKIKAAAHITGSGIENIPRVLPAALCAHVTAWEFPELFKKAQAQAGIDRDAMMTTFNCGVGMVLVVSAKDKARVLKAAQIYFKKKNVVMDPFELGLVKRKTRSQSRDIVFSQS